MSEFITFLPGFTFNEPKDANDSRSLTNPCRLFYLRTTDLLLTFLTRRTLQTLASDFNKTSRVNRLHCGIYQPLRSSLKSEGSWEVPPVSAPRAQSIYGTCTEEGVCSRVANPGITMVIVRRSRVDGVVHDIKVQNT